ncbi:MAG: DUF3822 family protein [Muribaculaceae bacterium]|nr:DUF3822 family protein [Muribaculaceae bacterium]
MDSADNISSADNLAIYIRKGGIDTITGNSSRRNFASCIVDESITQPERILEEAVYANPWLLGDFARTDIIADAVRFALCPAAVADSGLLIAGTAKRLWHDCDTDSLTVEKCSLATAAITAFDRSLSGFVSRTFPRAVFHHRLTSLIDFFASLSRPVNKIKLYVHFAGDSHVDLIAFSAAGVMMANSFDCPERADSLYFIMAAVKDMGFDPLDDELVICGNHARCEQLTETLRRYLNSVMPLLLPAPENEMPAELLFYLKDYRQ